MSRPGSDQRPGSYSRAATPDRASAATPRRRSGAAWLVGGTLLGTGVAALVWLKEREHLASADEGMVPVSVGVPSGARPQTFPLADGSRVTLAPGSRIESREPFGGESRTLHLTGEALFNVAEGEAPFVVHAAGVKVEDVSTAFVVRAVSATAATPAQALVAVTQGEVRVFTADWEGDVHEGDAVVVDSSGAHSALDHVAARGSVAWTSGALLFTDEPVAAIVERLARWTGFDISVHPSLAERRLTIAIEGETPQSTMQHLASALDARAVVRGKRWSLQPE